MSELPIQTPFADLDHPDERLDQWSEDEIEMLLSGVAEGKSFDQISQDISAELRNRSPKACNIKFSDIAIAVRTQLFSGPA